MKARRRNPSADVPRQHREEANASLDAFLDATPRRPPKKNRGRKLSPLEVAVRDAETRARTGEWSDATGRSLVGLYAMCHRMVYGVLPTELEDAATIRIAGRMAKGQLHKHFDDDVDDAVEFIKWTWEREKERENYALRNGRERGRLGFRLQFSDSVLTDYRVALERDAKRRRSRR